MDPSVLHLAESYHFRFFASKELDQEIGLAERIVPSFEVDLFRHFELVSSLPSYFLENLEQIEEHLFTFELQFGPVKLEKDVLPFEVGDCLLTVCDKIINVPSWRHSFLAVQVSSVYLSQLFSFQILLICHQEITHKFLNPRID